MGNPEMRQLRATVSVHTRPLWRLRLGRELPRYLLCAASVVGLMASARFALAPPRPSVSVKSQPTAPSTDRAAEGYAALFARRYLTWEAAEPQADQRALASFLGPGMEPDAGLQLPPSGEQRVEWIEVVQQREPAAGEHIYTLAAQTDTAGLLYLTVGVTRQASGTLALSGYPAFVGAPSFGPARAPRHLREVVDPALSTVVARALRNYLAGSASELAADLTSGARVSLPGMGLSLDSVQQMAWSASGSSLLVLVQAQDGRGVQYTLDYELDVTRQQGRWEVSAVQMDPDT